MSDGCANRSGGGAALRAKEEVALLKWLATRSGTQSLARALDLSFAMPAARRAPPPLRADGFFFCKTAGGHAVLVDIRLCCADVSQVCRLLQCAADFAGEHAVLVAAQVPACTVHFLNFLNRNRRYSGSCLFHGVQLVSSPAARAGGKRVLIARTGAVAKGYGAPSLSDSPCSAQVRADQAYLRVRSLCERCTTFAGEDFVLVHPGVGGMELRVWLRSGGVCLTVKPGRKCEFRIECASVLPDRIRSCHSILAELAVGNGSSHSGETAIVWREIYSHGRVSGLHAVSDGCDETRICAIIARISASVNALVMC